MKYKLTFGTDGWIFGIVIAVCFFARVSTFVSVFIWSTCTDKNALAIRNTISIFIPGKSFITKTHIGTNLHTHWWIIWIILLRLSKWCFQLNRLNLYRVKTLSHHLALSREHQFENQPEQLVSLQGFPHSSRYSFNPHSGTSWVVDKTKSIDKDNFILAF